MVFPEPHDYDCVHNVCCWLYLHCLPVTVSTAFSCRSFFAVPAVNLHFLLLIVFTGPVEILVLLHAVNRIYSSLWLTVFQASCVEFTVHPANLQDAYSTCYPWCFRCLLHFCFSCLLTVLPGLQCLWRTVICHRVSEALSLWVVPTVFTGPMLTVHSCHYVYSSCCDCVYDVRWLFCFKCLLLTVFFFTEPAGDCVYRAYYRLCLWYRLLTVFTAYLLLTVLPYLLLTVFSVNAATVFTVPAGCCWLCLQYLHCY
jgi:hypothetical protein